MDGDVDDEQVPCTRDDIVEHILREEAMSLAHLVFEKGIEAVFAATCVVGELRVAIFLELRRLVVLIEAQEGELVSDFLQGLGVPLFDNATVLAFAVEHDDDSTSEAT